MSRRQVLATLGAASTWLTFARAARSAASAEPAPPPMAEPKTAADTVAEGLWSELYCMCGDCARMSLADCDCDDAKTERRAMRERVRALTKGGKSAEQAHAVELSAYLAHFGDGARVGHWHDKKRPFDWWGLAVPLAVACVGLALLVTLAERVRAKAAAARPATEGKQWRRKQSGRRR